MQSYEFRWETNNKFSMAAPKVFKQGLFFPEERQFKAKSNQDKTAGFIDAGRNFVVGLYFIRDEGGEIGK